MANRFPLILDTTDGNKLKELPAGDNLLLRNSSIIDVQNIEALGTINAANITINGNRLQPTAFTELTDVPSNYSGFEGFLVRVKNDGSGLEFFELGSEGIPLRVATITVSESILPDEPAGASIGSSVNKFDGIYGVFFQGAIKGNDGSVIFDPVTNQIPYAVIAGRPINVSDLNNDEGYVRAEELRAVIPEFIEEGLVTVEVTNTGDLIGNVIAEDSTILVDAASARLNTARLTQNGANPGQTIVWDDVTEQWIPGIAGDITGFSSNKVDTLTVESGYKITYQDANGVIESDILYLDTNTRLDVNEIQITGSNDIYPETTDTGKVGTSTNRFNEGNFVTVNATNITGSVTGSSSVVTTSKADIGVFGDKTQGDAGYSLHVIGDLGFTGGDLYLNGGNIFNANFEDVTGNFRGSFFADDSTIIIDGVNNTITGNLQFPSATGTITGNTVQIITSNRLEIDETQTSGDIFPNLDESGKIGTVARRYDEGNFITLRAEAFSIDTVTADSIETNNFLLTGTGLGTIESSTDLILQTGNRIIAQGGPFKFTNSTQVEIDTIVTLNGDSIYNTTTNRFNFYQNSNWVELHKGLFEGDVIGSLYSDNSTQIFDGITGKIISPTVSGNATFENNIIVQGDLTIQGTTTTIDTTNTTIKDNIIVLNQGEAGTGVTAGTSGIEIDRGLDPNKTLVWDDTSDKWSIGTETLVAGTIEAANVTGDDTGDIIGFVNITGSTGGDITGFTNITGDTGGDITGFTNITGDTGGTISGFTDITGDTGGDITGFTNITGDTGGDITGFTNITGDTGGTISGFTDITGDTGGSITGFTNITGDTGGDITGFTNITGDTGGTISGFTDITGDTGGTITGFTDITGDGGGTISGFDFTGNLTGDVTGNTIGYHTGDVTGSIFADDSTILVDAVNGLLKGPLIGDVTGSLFSDNSTKLVDGVSGTIVGPINAFDTVNSVIMDTVSGLQIVSTSLVEIQGAAGAQVGIGSGTSGDVYIGSGTNNVKIDVDSLELNITNVPGSSTGQNGDKQGMVAFDSTSIYYCIADWSAPGSANIWVKQDWGTTGAW